MELNFQNFKPFPVVATAWHRGLLLTSHVIVVLSCRAVLKATATLKTDILTKGMNWR